MKLYIIGNGFDLAHGLKTSYWNFRCYLEKYAEDFLIDFEKLYGFYPLPLDDYHISNPKDAERKRAEVLKEELWCSFEENLGQAQDQEMFDAAQSIAEQMDLDGGLIGIEDTMDIYWREQYGFVINLQEYLAKWVRQIRLNKAVPMKGDILLDCSDLFLTFNYTPTLERIYQIPKHRICHIHGGYRPYCDQAPIIGHGNYEAIKQYREQAKEAENVFDEIGISINNAVADFYQNSFKDTSSAILMNNRFFAQMSDVQSVEIIGLSLGDVDLPYIEHVKDNVPEGITWTVYYHDEEKKPSMEAAIRKLDISNIRFLPSTDFWDVE